MPAFDDEPQERRAKSPATYVIGENLDALSAPELDERIALCRIEIERLEAAKAARMATKAAADSFFRS